MLDLASTTDLWVRRYHPVPDARSRLVCLAHAGGAASYFFPVSRTLAPRNIEVLAVQYPGRQDRRTEPFVETIDELADQVTAVIGNATDKPLALFGHSMGATLGFEVARRLERAGTTPAALFVSGRRAPGTHRDEKVHLRDDAGVLAEVKALSGTDARVMDDDELVRMALPAIRNDYKAIETYAYRPGPKLACPIHAMVGETDPKATLDEVRAWAEHTDGRFDLDVFPGGHFYLDKHAASVLNKIAEAMPV